MRAVTQGTSERASDGSGSSFVFYFMNVKQWCTKNAFARLGRRFESRIDQVVVNSEEDRSRSRRRRA